MNTDTISDMITRIRNANLAKHRIVQIPYTKITKAITTLLLDENFIKDFTTLHKGSRLSLLIKLKYSKREPYIKKLQRISKPGSRVYSSKKKMPRVLSGFGAAIISTSSGLMTDRKARSKGIGGEILFYIW